MSDVTEIIREIESGDSGRAEQLLPLVYEELRKLAAAKLRHEKPGQTLQSTALVHEAYLRLVKIDSPSSDWNSRSHFFAAAAEAMRRILIENARRKSSEKHGGQLQRIELEDDLIGPEDRSESLLQLDEAIEKLSVDEPKLSQLVKLKVYSGLSTDEASDLLEIPRTTAFRKWKFARAWLIAEMNANTRTDSP